jgi:hypothetical protein
MFTKEFVSAGHTTRVTITRDVEGWQIQEERDSTVVKHVHYDDWHRVERALQALEFGRTQSTAVQEA